MNFRKEMILNRLLPSKERTTDILEDIVQNKLKVRVVKQEMKSDYNIESTQNEEFLAIDRETYLYSSKHDLIVSHNYVTIYPNFIPSDLYDAICSKNRGIGEVIRMNELHSERKIIQCGFRNKDCLQDLYYNDVSIQFSEKDSNVPFKEYTITFKNFNTFGMKILEYFNTEIFEMGMEKVSIQ